MFDNYTCSINRPSTSISSIPSLTALPMSLEKLLEICKSLNAIKIPLSESNIEKVIFNDPATIVIWSGGTKTLVKCNYGDKFNPEIGLAMCICKKVFGNTGRYNEVFKQWLPKENEI